MNSLSLLRVCSLMLQLVNSVRLLLHSEWLPGSSPFVAGLEERSRLQLWQTNQELHYLYPQMQLPISRPETLAVGFSSLQAFVTKQG
jgi:hypothetical protein